MPVIMKESRAGRMTARSTAGWVISAVPLPRRDRPSAWPSVPPQGTTWRDAWTGTQHHGGTWITAPAPAGHHPRIPARRRPGRTIRPAGQVRGDGMTQATARARQPVQQARQPGGARTAARQARLRQAARWVFLLPALAYVLFAFAIPVMYNLVLSFEQTSLATISHLTAPLAGLSNYTTTLRNPVAQSAIMRTFSFTVLSLLFQFIIGFALALLFNLRFPLRRFARSLILVPWLLPLLVTGDHLQVPVPAPGGRGQPDPARPARDPPARRVCGLPGLGVRDRADHQHLDRRPVLHRAAVQRAAGRPGRAHGGGPDRRGGGLAAADPGHAADHPAGDRGRYSSWASCSRSRYSTWSSG